VKVLRFDFSRVREDGIDIHKLEMNADINIITGRNGVGKTTALKLLWLLLSGNLKQAISECSFKVVFLETDEYRLLIGRNVDGSVERMFFKNKDVSYHYDSSEEGGDGIYGENENKKNRPLFESIIQKEFLLTIGREDRLTQILSRITSELLVIGSSLYFPTFRRIEGGFSPGDSKSKGSISNDLEDALSALSRKFSRGGHLFVSSFSMNDVSQFLLKEYSNLNDISSAETNSLSQKIILMIKSHKDSRNNLNDANQLLGNILENIERNEQVRANLMKPLTAVQRVVSKIFRHKGINFGENLNFGDAASAVNSDKLSAGEKQLLSFICYNAFFNNAVFIIDEPELSLHVDWQRSFFKILLDQNSSNQFIVSTHSPFIYAKYPDKEVSLNEDRGEGEVE